MAITWDSETVLAFGSDNTLTKAVHRRKGSFGSQVRVQSVTAGVTLEGQLEEQHAGLPVLSST